MPTTSGGGTTYAAFIREQINKGKSEPEIWRAMKRKFALEDESKRRYIQWYLPKNDNAKHKAA